MNTKRISIHLLLFFTVLSHGPQHVFAQLIQNQEKIAVGEINFNPLTEQIEGEIIYQLPPSLESLTLTSLPNLYLQSDKETAEETFAIYTSPVHRQFSNFSFPSSLYLKESSYSLGKGCFDKKYLIENNKNFEWKAIPLSHSNTLIQSRFLITPNYQTCHFLKLKFITTLAKMIGNNSYNEKMISLSFPPFPFVNEPSFNYEVIYNNLTVHCPECETSENKTLFRMKGIPNGAFLEKKESQIKEIVPLHPNLNLIFFGFKNNEHKDLILRLIKSWQKESDFLTSLVNFRHGNFYFYYNVLAKMLLARNPNEIQFNSKFFNAPFYLSYYYQAAFFRLLMSELFFENTLQIYPNLEDINEVKRINALAKIASEIHLNQVFIRTKEIKNWSKKLDFLPIARSISQGKAFEHSNIILGQEEEHSWFDVSLFDSFYHTLPGAGLVERLKWCLEDQEYSAFEKKILNLTFSENEISALINKSKKLESERCPALQALFTSYPEQETMTVSKDKEQIVFQRKTIKSSGLQTDSPSFSDSLVLQKKVDKEPTFNQIWLGQSQQSTVRWETEDSDATYSIEGPKTDENSEMHRYPYSLFLSLTSFSLGYSSRTNQIDFSQGLTLSLPGIDKESFISFNFLKKLNYYNLNSKYGINYNLLYGLLTPSIGLNYEIYPLSSKWFILSLIWNNLNSNHYLPKGYRIETNYLRKLISAKHLASKYHTDIVFSIAYPILSNLAWSGNVMWGMNENLDNIDLFNNLNIFPITYFYTDHYLLFYTEVQKILFSNLNLSLLKITQLENLQFYLGHSSALDLMTVKFRKNNHNKFQQSMHTGIRFYGSFLEAKDQYLSLNYERQFDPKVNSAFSFSISKKY